MYPGNDKRFQEFELIEYLRTRLAPDLQAETGPNAVLENLKQGIGDDAAIIEIPTGRELVVTMDTLVEGVHFERGLAASTLGYKALAVNLSDLAAMGAWPGWYFLGLTVPSVERDWAEQFCDGMGELASRFSIVLAGGDVTLGPLSVTITACGSVEAGQALKRSGAQIGNRIAISGTTGLAAKGLRDLSAGVQTADECRDALYRPEPRVRLGQLLAPVANSCIDISDGLLADLEHTLRCSGVAAELQLASLPGHSALDDLPDEERWNLQLAGGDDYELCFTYSEHQRDSVAAIATEAETKLTEIGQIVAGDGCRCLRPDGASFEPASRGYVHGAGR